MVLDVSKGCQHLILLMVCGIRCDRGSHANLVIFNTVWRWRYPAIFWATITNYHARVILHIRKPTSLRVHNKKYDSQEVHKLDICLPLKWSYINQTTKSCGWLQSHELEPAPFMCITLNIIYWVRFVFTDGYHTLGDLERF